MQVGCFDKGFDTDTRLSYCICLRDTPLFLATQYVSQTFKIYV